MHSPYTKEMICDAAAVGAFIFVYGHGSCAVPQFDQAIDQVAIKVSWNIPQSSGISLAQKWGNLS